MMMHQAAGSICVAYEVSDIYLCDFHQRLCITEAPDGVYIPPMLEIELHIDDMRYLSHISKICSAIVTTLHEAILV